MQRILLTLLLLAFCAGCTKDKANAPSGTPPGDPPTLEGGIMPGVAIYREFENGVVLANLSDKPYTFDLAVLFPNRKFRRIQASSTGDPVTNNGKEVASNLTLPRRDAIFLVEVK